ncbi:hypothetical protein D3C80_2153290 [compost metagenome]
MLAGLKRSGDYDQTRDEPIAEGPILNKDTAHVGYTNRDQGRFPFKEDFATQLDTALDAMRRAGEVDRIIQRYTD